VALARQGDEVLRSGRLAEDVGRVRVLDGRVLVAVDDEQRAVLGHGGQVGRAVTSERHEDARPLGDGLEALVGATVLEPDAEGGEGAQRVPERAQSVGGDEAREGPGRLVGRVEHLVEKEAEVARLLLEVARSGSTRRQRVAERVRRRHDDVAGGGDLLQLVLVGGSGVADAVAEHQHGERAVLGRWRVGGDLVGRGGGRRVVDGGADGALR
jgi:hypothetical protein